MHPSRVTISELAAGFNSSIGSGLTDAAVLDSRAKYGENSIEDSHRFSLLRSALREISNPLSIVLIISMALAAFLGEFVNSLVIALALVINLSVSLWQEGGAAHVFEALEKETQHVAQVLRNGKEVVIQAHEVVVGDVLILTGGTRISADARLIEVQELATNEAALTGEWTTQSKQTDVLTTVKRSQEMTNMVWAGTYVAEGHGRALVTTVGNATLFGSLAVSATEQIERPTPLQDKLRALSRSILLIVAVAVACVFALGIMRGSPIGDMFFIALAVGIGAMPEGLPAVMTVVLSEAMRRILQKGGLVKRLVSAETFGSVTTIITDKTGTLTTGEMTFAGIATYDGVDESAHLTPLDVQVLTYAVRASDAFIEERAGVVTFNGRALEAAIISGGYGHGIDARTVPTSGHARITMVQFEPNRRYAISLNNHPEDGARMYLTGSPEHIMNVCSSICTAAGVVPLTQLEREHFMREQATAASQGKRFTAVAYRRASDRLIHEDVIHPAHGEQLGFVFGGLLLFADSIRPDVADALLSAKNAGITVYMATGDHPGTGLYVAERVGLIEPGSTDVVTGDALESMTDGEIVALLKQARVFARMLPAHKMRLAHVLQAEGHVVAMTGDGINDAPALVAADIGVTLSTGTDIAKEASDLVLMKDSFSVIIDAIAEGRRSLANIRTIVMYLLSVSFSTTVLVCEALIFNIPLPLLPVQMLWINVVVEGFMCFPFAYNPVRPETLLEKPPTRSAPLFDRSAYSSIIAIAFAKGTFLLGLFVYAHQQGVSVESARVLLFLTLGFGSILASCCFLDVGASLFKSFRFRNGSLYKAMALSTTLLLLGCAFPLSSLLSTQSMTMSHIVWALVCALPFMVFTEVSKFVFLRRPPVINSLS